MSTPTFPAHGKTNWDNQLQNWLDATYSGIPSLKTAINVIVPDVAPSTSAAPVDVYADLQAVLTAAPLGSIVQLSNPTAASWYYVSQELQIPSGVTLAGSGAPQRALNGGWGRGGSVIAPMPGASFAAGTAVVHLMASRSQLKNILVIAGSQADYAILDESSDSTLDNPSTFGGRVASYAGGGSSRTKIINPSFQGAGTDLTLPAGILGTDCQVLGGNINAGVTELRGNHVQLGIVHSTGGNPNMHVTGNGAVIAGCVIDSSDGTALLHVDGSAVGSTWPTTIAGVNFYYPSGSGGIPAMKFTATCGGTISAVVHHKGASATALSLGFQFGSQAVANRWAVDTADMSNAAALWDFAPGSYSGCTGNLGAAWLQSPPGVGATRPASPATGQLWFDTSLATPRPIWWTGTAWVDATGTTV